MADKTKIDYLDSTVNQMKGCAFWTSRHQTEGCDHCWARRMAHRYSKKGEAFYGLTVEGQWTGDIKLYPHELVKPVRWDRPRVIGINFMGDMFAEGADWRDQAAVFGSMVIAKQHQFLVLTKRPVGIEHFIHRLNRPSLRVWMDEQGIDPELLPAQLCVEIARRKTAEKIFDYEKIEDTTFPPKNVWIGTSIENQNWADQRLRDLSYVQAQNYWLSIEPMLEPIDIDFKEYPFINFVVVGGESGPGFRPMKLAWARHLRDKCAEAKIPFFFKQTAGKGPIPQDLMIRQLPKALDITKPKKAQNHGTKREKS